MSKKVSIVFHSICGNNFLISKEFYKEFKGQNADVQLLRVKDTNFDELAKQFTIGSQYKKEILNIEEAKVEKLFDSDIIILGSPTYFGNVSGAMKAFMDEFHPYWQSEKFYGKKMFAFTTCDNGEGGGDLCLNAMTVFAQNMGMITVPVPKNLVSGQNFPANGLIHYVGDYSNLRPSGKIIPAIKEMTQKLMEM
jgi:NAD(P)H dehydrogenase (quinone)